MTKPSEARPNVWRDYRCHNGFNYSRGIPLRFTQNDADGRFLAGCPRCGKSFCSFIENDALDRACEHWWKEHGSGTWEVPRA